MKAIMRASSDDAALVADTLEGDREAFGRIVARYQALICSLAYSATGSLSQGQDIAQETFVAAWRQLRDLREPAKLRAWLCRIARNRICDTLRERERDPVSTAEPLEQARAPIVNCRRPTGKNIGYPDQPEEVEWFLQMIQKAAPKISQSELAALETALKTSELARWRTPAIV